MFYWSSYFFIGDGLRTDKFHKSAVILKRFRNIMIHNVSWYIDNSSQDTYLEHEYCIVIHITSYIIADSQSGLVETIPYFIY